MNTSDIGFCYVSFKGAEGGKRRPVFILSIMESEVTFFSVSSKYAYKSAYIRAQYFEIVDWRGAGLPKASWIDIDSKRTMDISDVSFDLVGTLPPSAVNELADFIESYPARIATMRQ